MNLILENIYRLVFFKDKLHRVLQEIEKVLQFSPEMRIRDRFLLKEHTIIKVYGFFHEL